MGSPLGIISPGFPKINNNQQKGTNSIFNKNKWYYRPNDSDSDNRSNSPRQSYNGSDGVYDISTKSIMDYLNRYDSMKLSQADFAYLKDFGVYPNNRLIIARRFRTPVDDDLTIVEQQPISSLVSWYDEYPIKMTFNEEWRDADSDILDLLDSMFKSDASGTQKAMDGFFSGGVPLPGFSEGLQFEILRSLGYSDAGLDNIPSGNPNLIKSAKQRSVGGDGLKTSFSIDLETTYEQKFLGGNDPTLIYLDIINNVLRFGTSESTFFLNAAGNTFITEFFDKFRKGEWIDAISFLMSAIIKGISNTADTLITKLSEIKSGVVDLVNGENDVLSGLLKEATKTIGGAVFSKYKVKINGVLASLTGMPSTPWHITVGNPKSPSFSSGDLLCESVTITMGDTLSYNDLPSTITITTKLTNARPLGMQEIFKKYNTGRGRIYSEIDQTLYENKKMDEKLAGQELGADGQWKAKPAETESNTAPSTTNQVQNKVIRPDSSEINGRP